MAHAEIQEPRLHLEPNFAMMKHLLLPALFALASWSAAAQGLDCSFTLVTSQTNSSGITRWDSIAYSFEGPNTAIMMFGQRGQPDVRLLFDPAAKTITQLHEINGKKGGFVFAMSEKRWPGMPYSTVTAGSGEQMDWTGKQKEIADHECHEAMAENADYTALVWVAKDIPLSMLRVFSYMSVGAGKSTEEAELLAQMSLSGFPMEMHLTSKADKPKVTIRVENFRSSPDLSLFDTAGHTTTFVED